MSLRLGTCWTPQGAGPTRCSCLLRHVRSLVPLCTPYLPAQSDSIGPEHCKGEFVELTQTQLLPMACWSARSAGWQGGPARRQQPMPEGGQERLAGKETHRFDPRRCHVAGTAGWTARARLEQWVCAAAQSFPLGVCSCGQHYACTHVMRVLQGSQRHPERSAQRAIRPTYCTQMALPCCHTCTSCSMCWLAASSGFVKPL